MENFPTAARQPGQSLLIGANGGTGISIDTSQNATFAGTITGNGSGITSLTAANLTGALPAISGASLTSLNASNISSGTISSSRIGNGAITLARMANLAANSVIGNNTGSSAVPVALTQAQLTAMIDDFTSALSGAVPASGGGTTNFLRADGTWASALTGAALLAGNQTFTGNNTFNNPVICAQFNGVGDRSRFTTPDAVTSRMTLNQGSFGQSIVFDFSGGVSHSLTTGGGSFTGFVNGSTELRVASTKVVGTRATGWAAATGTATRTTFATSTVTTAQLAERVKALIDDLISHGLIGT